MSAHDLVAATNFVLSVCVFALVLVYLSPYVCVCMCAGVCWSYASASRPGPSADC